jgi:hypothetical protein
MPEFRYYVHHSGSAFSFELAGRLSDESVRELQHAWRTASSVIRNRSLIVDLSYVTGIDVAGQRLVREWHDRGAQLVAKSPEARVLVQSITGQSVDELSATARHSTWLPFRTATLLTAKSTLGMFSRLPKSFTMKADRNNESYLQRLSGGRP